jgi:hypothetical protein
MKATMNGHRILYKAITLLCAMAILVTMSTQMRAATGSCAGADVNVPFEDIQGNPFFCHIASAYFSGLTSGTSATTYSPTQTVPREQMAAFITRTLDQSLRRGSRRAALEQWWTPKDEQASNKLSSTLPGYGLMKSDGKDLWVLGGTRVSRISPIDGKLKAAYSDNLNSVRGLVIARGRVYAAGGAPGFYSLYEVNPTIPPLFNNAVTIKTNQLGNEPMSLAFDGKQFWTANAGGSVSLIDPADNFSVVTKPLGSQPKGMLFDGKNIWVTDSGNGNLYKMDAFGFVIQTIPLGGELGYPTFDGTNIWVPGTSEGKVYVVRAANGALLSTLQFGIIHNFFAAAFDGERVAVTDTRGYIHIWQATDLTYIGNIATEAASTPNGICSDGKRFWAGVNVNLPVDPYAYLMGF